jgi:inhibitor of KinA
VRFLPAGDLAVLVEFDEEISVEVNTRVRALEFLIQQKGLPGVVETVPAFRSLLVYYDPRAVGYDALCASIAELSPQATTAVLPPSRLVELPCCYDDPEHLVYFIGFTPGLPYMTGMPDRLTIPRLPTPRTKTPAGSVGIGGTQCCVYSVESPGGFWILGRTPLRLYDPGVPEPILLRPGDRVRFRATDRGEYDRIAARVDARAYVPVIT